MRRGQGAGGKEAGAGGKEAGAGGKEARRQEAGARSREEARSVSADKVDRKVDQKS